MAQMKAGEVERFVARPDPAYRIILIYGPDRGLVSERVIELSKKTGVDLSDPFSLIRLDLDDIGEDHGRLMDEVNTIGMFGGERLIRIAGNTRRDITKPVTALLNSPPLDAWVIFEAGDLKKTAPLRKLVEKSPKAMALPCYQDNDGALSRLISQILGEHGLRLSRENEMLLRSLLGGDRQASRGELEKLALYAMGETEITQDHIREIVGDASSLVVDEVIDNVAIGQMTTLETDLKKLIDTGTSPDMIMLAGLRHFQMLHEARSRMELNRAPAATMVASMRPPVHFSRKNKVESALSKWKMAALERTLDRLNQASFDCRKNSDLAPSIAGTALLAIAIEAQRSR